MIKSKKLIKYKKIRHGFFNRNGGTSKGIYKSLNCGPGSGDKKENVNKNLNIISKKIGFKKKNLILLNQIHSNKLFQINKLPKKKLKGDGIITSKKKIALGILTADCAPVFIYDPVNELIGSMHVGWKGAYKKIVVKMLNIFLKKGTRIKNLIAVIGPCIAQNSYEVKNDFRQKFLNQNKENSKYFKFKAKKIYFSLGDFIKSQMINFGLKNVEIIKKDTFIKKNNFFSSRNSLKNHEKDYGRNISVIMIK